MKILKQGNLPTAQAKCEYCGCEFEFDVADVDFDKVPEYPVTIRCPQCNHKQFVGNKLELIKYKY